MNINYEAIAKKADEKTRHLGVPLNYVKAVIDAYAAWTAERRAPEWVPLDLEKVKQGQEVRGKCWIGATAANFVAVYNGNIIVEQKGVGFTQHMNEGDNWLMRAPRPKTVHVRVFKMPDGEYVSTAGRFFDGYQVVGEGDIEVLE